MAKDANIDQVPTETEHDTVEKLGYVLDEWRARGETEEVPRVLRQLQTIRLGTLRLGQDTARTLMTEIPKNLNEQLIKLKLTALFAAPPKT